MLILSGCIIKAGTFVFSGRKDNSFMGRRSVQMECFTIT